jgi:outer membrane protein assembly factor BamB
VWASEPIAGDNAGYASPLLFEFGGRRHLASMSSRHAFGVDADSGKLQWTTEFVNRYQVNVCTPVYAGGRVLFVSPDGPNATAFDLGVQGDRTQAKEAWKNDLDTCTGAGVLVDGTYYGAGYRKLRGWRGLDWKTGEAKFDTTAVDSGSAIWADGRLYILSESGPMWLIKPTPTGFEVCGRFDLVPPAVGRKRDVWAHPVLLDGRLYLRHHDTLWCYDVRGK